MKKVKEEQEQEEQGEEKKEMKEFSAFAVSHLLPSPPDRQLRTLCEISSSSVKQSKTKSATAFSSLLSLAAGRQGNLSGSGRGPASTKRCVHAKRGGGHEGSGAEQHL
eukprot:766209-Hanusia_phi.AAC.5